MAPQPTSPPAVGVSPPLAGGGPLEELFPPFARGALARIDARWTSQYPEELALVARAVPSRRREFLCGRACAHAALRALGRDDAPIPAGDRRQPLWPEGVVGSISHAGSLAGAVVASASDAWGLGLDIELLEPALDPRVRALVLTPRELALASEPGVPKVLFSVKECVYKCVFPRTGWRLDHRQVEVTPDLERGRYRAVIEQQAELPALEGAFRLVGDYVISALHVGA